MKNVKRISLGIILVLCISILLSVTSFASTQVKVTVNGEMINFPDAQPFINEDSRTLVPVRFVSEALGAEVTWYQEEQQVYITKGDSKITLTIGEQEFFTNHGYVTMDTRPVIIQDRTYVPLRFVSEALESLVIWEQETFTVHIKDITPPISKAEFETDINPETGEIVYPQFDKTPTKEVIVFADMNINIEEGDTHSIDSDGYLVINKYSGLTIKYYPEDFHPDLKNEGDITKKAIFIFDRNKDMNQQIYDISDSEIFYASTDEDSIYRLEKMIVTNWTTGIGDKEFYNDINALEFNVRDGENNTIVLEQINRYIEY